MSVFFNNNINVKVLNSLANAPHFDSSYYKVSDAYVKLLSNRTVEIIFIVGYSRNKTAY